MNNDPIWIPKSPENSQMWQFMQFINSKFQLKISHYQTLHAWSIKQPQFFWDSLVEFYKIKWHKDPQQVINNDKDMFHTQWFLGAQFNFAQKLLSRRDNHPALISLNENGERHFLSYQDLYLAVAQCAAGLKALDVGVGDRIAAIMPNTSQTIIAMLACTSLGAIWSSCSSDFGAQAAFDRLGQIEPKILFIGDGHQYHGKKYSAKEKAQFLSEQMPTLQQIIICPNIHEPFSCTKGVLWEDFLKPETTCHFTSLPFDHPVYILFSSGTTGKPKCIVHGAGGTLLQHVKELALHTDLSEKDNLCFYTTCGWMMWNWMVSALALGTTLTLYEGSPTHPKSNSLFQILEDEKITVLGTSAKFISTVEKMGLKPNAHFDFVHLRCILSTGSPLLPSHYDFVYEKIKKDVQLSSISGGTDILSCFALGNPMTPVYRGELQCLGLGMAVEVFNEEGHSIRGQRGELVCTKAFPSMPLGFWQDLEKKLYHKAYFERFANVWAHGDFAEITPHEGLIIYGRSDAILNPGGVRIGTAEIYRQVEQIPEIVESIVIGQNWQEDVRVILFVKLQKKIELDDNLIHKIKQQIRQNASPRHVPAKILQVHDIPRTLNGKIVELAVKQVVEGLPVANLQSLANPKTLDEFKNRPELQ